MICYCGKSVGDDDGRPSSASLIESLLNDCFALRVKGRRGFVE